MYPEILRSHFLCTKVHIVKYNLESYVFTSLFVWVCVCMCMCESLSLVSIQTLWIVQNNLLSYSTLIVLIFNLNKVICEQPLWWRHISNGSGHVIIYLCFFISILIVLFCQAKVHWTWQFFTTIEEFDEHFCLLFYFHFLFQSFCCTYLLLFYIGIDFIWKHISIELQYNSQIKKWDHHALCNVTFWPPSYL